MTKHNGEMPGPWAKKAAADRQAQERQPVADRYQVQAGKPKKQPPRSTDEAQLDAARKRIEAAQFRRHHGR